MREAIHGFFSLSYANYLVIPRSVLQSMPDKWQSDFVDLLNKIPTEYIDRQYWVRRCDCKGTFLSDDLSNYERGRRKVFTLKEAKP